MIAFNTFLIALLVTFFASSLTLFLIAYQEVRKQMKSNIQAAKKLISYDNSSTSNNYHEPQQ